MRVCTCTFDFSLARFNIELNFFKAINCHKKAKKDESVLHVYQCFVGQWRITRLFIVLTYLFALFLFSCMHSKTHLTRCFPFNLSHNHLIFVISRFWQWLAADCFSSNDCQMSSGFILSLYGISLLKFWFHYADYHYIFNEYDFIYLVIEEISLFHK